MEELTMKLNYHDVLAKGKIKGAHPGGFNLTKQLFSDSPIENVTKVLDAGCGMGQTSIYLAKTFGCSVIAVDNHPDMIKHVQHEVLKSKLPIQVCKANLEHLPFQDHSFDVIIAESVITFTNIRQSFQELFRVLKLGGRLVMIEMAAEEDLTEDEEKDVQEFYHIKKVLTEADWIEFMKQAGFNNINVLKSKTILQELKEIQLDYQQQTDFTEENNVNEEIEDILVDQSILLTNYADKIGYRVFETFK